MQIKNFGVDFCFLKVKYGVNLVVNYFQTLFYWARSLQEEGQAKPSTVATMTHRIHGIFFFWGGSLSLKAQVYLTLIFIESSKLTKSLPELTG